MGEGEAVRKGRRIETHVRHALTGEDAVDTDFELWRKIH